ncbi:MAG: leucyl aminopeptidase family protein [Desulfurococcales archaeon]|nr:leucyl aminopeptidase family protein [Desulfurococcales archaeon]
MVLWTKPPTLEIFAGDPVEFEGPIIVPVQQVEGKPSIPPVLEKLDKELSLGVRELVEAEKIKGKKGELLEIVRGKKIVVVVGLGESPDAETVRRAYAKASKKYVNTHESVLLVVTPLPEDLRVEAYIGAALGVYVLEEFKTEKKRKLAKLFVDSGLKGAEEAKAIVEGVYLARDLANAPPNHLYPERIAEIAQNLFPPLGVEVEVFDYERLLKEGFGGIVSVGKGSAKKPVLIVLKYRRGEGKPVALVGKTIVFDSGGINLKPSHSVGTMKYDKAGGAAVLGALWTIAKAGLKANVYVLLPAAINAPGGESYLPSDVIKMWDGTWLEIGNTDAEGRVVLSDAVAYAAKGLEADTIVTFATLTGAIVLALGPLIAGVFTRDEDLLEKIKDASKASGDKVWPMPMDEDYKPLLAKSAKTGDVNNIATRWGDPIYASFLLEKFSHGKRFAHIDMAGPGFGAEGPVPAPDYWPKGSPGFGARLAYELVKRLVKG